MQKKSELMRALRKLEDRLSESMRTLNLQDMETPKTMLSATLELIIAKEISIMMKKLYWMIRMIQNGHSLPNVMFGTTMVTLSFLIVNCPKQRWFKNKKGQLP